MNNTGHLLERQTTWPKAREDHSWPDKIRQAESLRDTILQLRRTRRDQLKSNDILPIAKRAS